LKNLVMRGNVTTIEYWDPPKGARPCAGSSGDVLSPHGPFNGYTTLPSSFEIE
jgi:hypothetical protein